MDPPVSLSSIPLEPFSDGAFGQNAFSLWAGAFLSEPFSVFSVKSLVFFVSSQISPWFFSVSSQISPWTKTLIPF